MGAPRSLFGDGWRRLPEADPQAARGRRQGQIAGCLRGGCAPPAVLRGRGEPHKVHGAERVSSGGPGPRQVTAEAPQDPPPRAEGRGRGGVCSAGRDALKRGCPLKKIIIIKAKKKKKERGKI